MKEIISEVIRMVKEKFPSIKVKYEIVDMEGEEEIFILVDNREIYESKEFLEFAYYLEYDYLFKKGEMHFYIVCEPEKFSQKIENYYDIKNSQFNYNKINLKNMLSLLIEDDTMELAA